MRGWPAWPPAPATSFSARESVRRHSKAFRSGSLQLCKASWPQLGAHPPRSCLCCPLLLLPGICFIRRKTRQSLCLTSVVAPTMSACWRWVGRGADSLQSRLARLSTLPSLDPPHPADPHQDASACSCHALHAALPDLGPSGAFRLSSAMHGWLPAAGGGRCDRGALHRW